MKSRFFRIAPVLLSLLLLSLTALAAAPQPSQITVELRPSVSIVVDGTERTFYDVTGHEVHTIFYQGTHYLPVRAIGELMGKNVNWDGSTKTVTLSSPRTSPLTAGTPDTAARDGNITVQLRPDISIVIDGVTQSFKDAAGNPVYPILSGGTNYLPVRAIGEMMGKTVAWNGQTRTITLSAPAADDPLVTDADTFGPASGTNPGTVISREAARAAALTHAGLTAEQVSFAKTEMDWEDGRQIYEVEFCTWDFREYDYEIDAYTGAVLAWDYDAENVTPPASQSTYIGEDAARRAALAQVPGASSGHICKVKLDCEDSRWQYEVEIDYGGTYYEFEIDACSGNILGCETEHHGSDHHSTHR